MLIFQAMTNLQSKKYWENYFNAQVTKYPILFLHGITGKLNDWKPTIELISNSNYSECIFTKNGPKIVHKNKNSYSSRIINATYYTPNLIYEFLTGDISLYANRLEEIVKLIFKDTKLNKVIII